MRLGVLVVVSVAAMIACRTAHAEDKEACVDASTTGQKVRDARKLKDARSKFLFCARQECPEIVRTACAEWLGEVDARLPTLVVRAQDVQGRDVVDARVTLDGEPLALDGKLVSVDPGPHVLRYEREGSAPVEERVVVAEGEKGRVIIGRLPARATTSNDAASTRRPGVPALSWVLGGVSLVGAGGFAFFGLTAHSDLDHLKATCAPRCAESDLDAVKSKALLGDIALGVGVVALAAAIYIAVSSRTTARDTTALPPWVARF